MMNGNLVIWMLILMNQGNIKKMPKKNAKSLRPQQFFVPGPLPDFATTVERKAKSHWAAYRDIKKIWTESVYWVCRACAIEPMDRVFISFQWQELNRQRDPDNIAFAKKFVMDGLVQAKVLKNDGWNEVEGWTDTFVVNKNDPGVLVTLSPVF